MTDKIDDDSSPKDRSPRSEEFEEAMRKMKRDNINYSVGKWYPPEEHQFKLGESGNPAGRPKGSKNKPKHDPTDRLTDMIVRKGNEIIKSRDGKISKTKKEALVDAILASALSGVPRSQRLASDIILEAEAAEHDQIALYIQTAFDYKRDWTKRLKERVRHGVHDLPEPNPHPDNIHVFISPVRVVIYDWYPDHVIVARDEMKEIRRVDQEDLELCVSFLQDPQYRDYWPMIEKDIEMYLSNIKRCDAALAYRPQPIHIPHLED